MTNWIRRGSVIAAACALLGATPNAARAVNFVCGGSTFATCASVIVTAVNGANPGEVQISITVTNYSGQNGTFGGTTFTDIGVWGLGNFTYVSGSLAVSGAPLSNWALTPNGLSGTGIQPKVAGVGATAPPPAHGLTAGNTITFTFSVTGITAASVNTGDWAIHGQTGPLGCSTKLVATNGAVNNGPYDVSCGVDPGDGTVASVVPEPASVFLLGTGLLGLGAGAVARRRRSL